ncbi:MAG: hypothetical protein PHF56_15980 [Desulfuromonadaceae bacterium]|nr:hypothetical protein [Desulfuromonadaceae bacterium]
MADKEKAVKRADDNPRFRMLVTVTEIGTRGLWYQLSPHPRIVMPSR